jgi:capsule polysaccharide export protein KpsE/RkpR
VDEEYCDPLEVRHEDGKDISMNRLIPLVILAVSVVLVVYGVSASKSFSSVDVARSGPVTPSQSGGDIKVVPSNSDAGTYELLFEGLDSKYPRKIRIQVEDVPLKSWYQDWIQSEPVQSAMVE